MEVVPHQQLMPRAQEIAEKWAKEGKVRNLVASKQVNKQFRLLQITVGIWIPHIWIPNFLEFRFQMVQYLNGRSKAMSYALDQSFEYRTPFENWTKLASLGLFVLKMFENWTILGYYKGIWILVRYWNVLTNHLTFYQSRIRSAVITEFLCVQYSEPQFSFRIALNHSTYTKHFFFRQQNKVKTNSFKSQSSISFMSGY